MFSWRRSFQEKQCHTSTKGNQREYDIYRDVQQFSSLSTVQKWRWKKLKDEVKIKDWSRITGGLGCQASFRISLRKSRFLNVL